jgi:uncharacterized protein YneF (UPF0154 family)
MDLPSSTHVVYIPVILLIGMVVGFFLGRRAEADQAGRRRPIYEDDNLDDF